LGIDWISHSPLLQVVLALLAGGVGLPIPEELALVTAGYWLSRQAVAPALLIPAAIAAVLAGDLMLYFAGRGGRALGGARRRVGAERLARLERAFARHGAKLLLVGRFVPGLRSALLIAAGAARMPLFRLALCDGSAALVGAAGWIALGYRLGPELARARVIADRAHLVMAVVAVVILIVVVSWQKSWREVSAPTPTPNPSVSQPGYNDEA
jgi:membrane protein DedA with SNARE-associated domain